MVCDAVWYLPEKKNAALQLVRRLDSAEIEARGLDPQKQGLRFRLKHVPIPGEDGKQVASGNCAMVNALGTQEMDIGSVQPDKTCAAAEFFTFEKAGEGLVTGMFKPEIWDRSDVQEWIEIQRSIEERGAKNSKAAHDQDIITIMHQWLHMCAAVMGVQDPTMLSVEMLTTFAQAAQVAGKQPLSLDDWMAARAPAGVVYDDPEQAASASLSYLDKSGSN